MSGAITAAVIVAGGSYLASENAKGGGGGSMIMSDEEKDLLRERNKNQALLRTFAEGGNTYDPYSQLNVRDAIDARLNRLAQRNFTAGQNALNATGGATGGQLVDLQRRLGEDVLNQGVLDEEKLQYARAGHQASTQLAGISGIGGGPAPTPTYIADQPKPDTVGAALGQLGGQLTSGYMQDKNQAASDKRFYDYLNNYNNKSQNTGTSFNSYSGNQRSAPGTSFGGSGAPAAPRYF